MTKKTKMTQVILLALTAVALAACGNDEPTSAANTTAAQNNPYGYNGNYQFYNQNGQGGGYVGQNPFNFPIMKPSDGGNSPYSWNSGVQARSGQRVYVSVFGRWGALDVQARSIFGGIFKIKYNTYEYKCDELDFNGRQRDGTQSSFEGQPAGLRAAVIGSGTNFAVGSSGSFIADRDGPVVVGVNTDGIQGMCHRASAINVSVSPY